MEDCKDSLTFDTDIIKSDYFALTSILSLVTKDNYSEAKERWGASVPDYFSLDYDSFSRRRERLSEMFAEANITISSSEHYKHALSPDAAQNYATCMATKSNKPLIAWLEAVDDTSFQIATLNRMADTTVQCQVVGNPKPLNDPSKLITNAKEILEFPWTPRNGSSVTLNVKNVATGNVLDGVVIKIAPVRKIEKRTEHRTLKGTIRCGAGGYGSTTANQIYGNTSFVADPSFSILPDSIKEVGSSGFGLIRKDVQWVAKIVDGRVARLDSSIKGSEADNGNEQRIMEFMYEVQSARDYFVEIMTEAVPE